MEEKQRTIKNDILSFARRYFSHEEVDFLAAIPNAEVQRQEFLKLWTLKVGYVSRITCTRYPVCWKDFMFLKF